MNDLISRQAAIDAVDGNVIVTSKESAQAVIDYIRGCADRIRSLPSAQQEIIRCKDCRYYRWASDMCDYPYATAQNVVHEDDFCSKAERRTDGSD